MTDNLFNANDIAVSQELRETANPVFNTAKMTLFVLALSGDEDAKRIVSQLGLKAEVQGTSEIKLSKQDLLCIAVGIWLRFNIMNLLSEHSGFGTEIDLPCGYTPKAAKFARKDKKFVGLDLPAVITEFEPVIMPMIEEDKRGLVKFQAVDATNYDSLKEVFDGIQGEVCITTEGLLMYFTESETSVFLDNIRRLLKAHGGCWITADPETFILHFQLAKIFLGDDARQSLVNIDKKVQSKSDINLKDFVMLINPENVQEGTDKVMRFLNSHGLKAERMILADHMPDDFAELAVITHEQAEKVRAAMKDIAFWKVTLDDSQEIHNLKEMKLEKFNLNAKLISDRLELIFTGRVDTLNAPDILAFYEKLAGEHEINSVLIDCTGLNYISSAGLRVLLIIHKRTKNGVILKNVNAPVREILTQTGFDSIMNVKA